MNTSVKNFLQGITEGYKLMADNSYHRQYPTKRSHRRMRGDESSVSINRKATRFALTVVIWTTIFAAIFLSAIVRF